MAIDLLALDGLAVAYDAWQIGLWKGHDAQSPPIIVPNVTASPSIKDNVPIAIVIRSATAV